MASRDEVVAVATREVSSRTHTRAPRAAGTPSYSMLAHILSESDDDEDPPAVGTPTDVAPFNTIDVRLSHAADERPFTTKVSRLAVSSTSDESAKDAVGEPSTVLDSDHQHKFDAQRKFLFTLDDLNLADFGVQSEPAVTLTASISTPAAQTRPRSSLDHHSAQKASAAPRRRRLSLPAMVIVSGGLGEARAKLNGTTTTPPEESWRQDERVTEQLVPEDIPRTPPEQWTMPEMPSTPHVPLGRARQISRREVVRNGLQDDHDAVDMDDESDEESDGLDTSTTPELSESDDLRPPFTPRIGQLSDEDLVDDKPSAFDDQWEEEDGQGDAEQFSFFDDSYASEEGTSPAEVEQLWDAVVNGDGALDDSNNSWADPDCGSESGWDDGASTSSYDTLSNWASEPNDPEPNARDDWSEQPKSRRIVEPRKVEPMTPEQSWADATARARRGCQAHGESVEGPWDANPSGSGGVVDGWWEGDTPPQYDDEDACSLAPTDFYDTGRGLRSDATSPLETPTSPGATNGSADADDSRCQRTDLRGGTCSDTVAAGNHDAQGQSFTYVRDGEYVSYDPDVDPVARHSGWHPRRPELPPIIFLRPRDMRFDLSTRDCALPGMKIRRTARAVGGGFGLSVPPTKGLNRAPPAPNGEQQPDDGNYYWPRCPAYLEPTMDRPITLHIHGAVDGHLTFWDAVRPIAYVELRTIAGPPAGIASAQLYCVRVQISGAIDIVNVNAEIETLGPNTMLKVVFPPAATHARLFRLLVRVVGFMQLAEIRFTTEMLSRRIDMA